MPKVIRDLGETVSVRAELEFVGLMALGLLGYVMQDVYMPLAAVILLAFPPLAGVLFWKRADALAASSGRMHRAVFGRRIGAFAERTAAPLYYFLGIGFLVMWAATMVAVLVVAAGRLWS